MQRSSRTPRSRREILRLGAGAVAAALFAAGCGGDDGVGGTSIALRDLDRTDRRPAAGHRGVLHVAVPGRADALRDALVCSQLVAVDPRTALLSPDLATAVEFVDPLTVVCTLRREVRFHPNRAGLAVALTASDVSRDFAARAAAGEFLFAQAVERVEAPNPRTVRLQMRGPFSLLFESLADPAAAGIRGTEPSAVDGRPLGSGPFVPAARDDAGLALARNPLYHRALRPALDGVTVAALPQERDAATAYARGALDLHVHSAVEAPQFGERADSKDQRRAATSLVGLGLSLLGQKGGRAVRFLEAFQDQRVRRAVWLALDRTALLQNVDGVISGPVGPAHAADALPQVDVLGHPLYQHQPEQARALLAAAQRSGLPLRLQGPSTPALRTVAQAVATQLAAAGFAPQLQLLDPREWERNLHAGDFEATLFRLDGLTTPDQGLRLHSAAGLEGGFSPWGYSNPVFDAALRGVLSALDPAERARRSREAQRALLDDVPAMVPLYTPWQHASVAAAVGGYEFDGYGFNDSWLAARWSLAATSGGASG